MLRRNPHYDLARRLGQLRELRMRVEPDPDGRHPAPHGRRLGDLNPKVLEPPGTRGTID